MNTNYYDETLLGIFLHMGYLKSIEHHQSGYWHLNLNGEVVTDTLPLIPPVRLDHHDTKPSYPKDSCSTSESSSLTEGLQLHLRANRPIRMPTSPQENQPPYPNSDCCTYQPTPVFEGRTPRRLTATSEIQFPYTEVNCSPREPTTLPDGQLLSHVCCQPSNRANWPSGTLVGAHA
ncbi:hypothetical protein J6590_062275 [Homalodisca vitripennis]|nr:hypothetical protein J6590_062275 [Homalodisca vitripennis]